MRSRYGADEKDRKNKKLEELEEGEEEESLSNSNYLNASFLISKLVFCEVMAIYNMHSIYRQHPKV